MPANVEVITGDILEVDLLDYASAGPVRVAGNLPYNLSSPILFKLLAAQRGQPPFPGARNGDSRRFLDATVMLQREVADRLVARPGTKDYGVLTIFTGVHADVERLLTLPPGAVRPAPRVHSAVVRLTFVTSRIAPELAETFERMVRVMFTQRRKTVGNALRPFAESVGRDAVSTLSAAHIDPGVRPETLDLGALARLAAAFGPA